MQQATLNLHQLFSMDAGYLKALRVPDDDRDTLREAREQVRATLRSAFQNWEQHVARTELVEGSLLKSVQDVRLPTPKFRIQGSFAYHTVIDCQQTPPQQIDQDDGIFLPLNFISVGGKVRPEIASKAYFKLVESALAPLCKAKGWTLNPGRVKDTCVRIELGERLHIDLPLYAMEDRAFGRLVEARAQDSLTKSMMRDAVELSDDLYTSLAQNEIMLAHRKLGWIGSDPRRLEDWFTGAVALYGEQVRRLSKAMKGMRDARWASCDFGSICLMAALVKAYENLGEQDQGRDDLALMHLAREMANVLAEPIENPVFPGEADKNLCNGWPPGFREEVREVFNYVADELNEAINGSLHKDLAIKHATNAFGSRVPSDTSLITILGGAPAIIRQAQPEPLSKPMPPRTKSG